jgi:hypothetical protein
MGLPINSYTLFEAFAQNDGEFIKNIPVDFKLFAILLHDPKTDPEFDQVVGRSFYNWHLNSGNKLLLTALADPPQSWMHWARENKGPIFGENRILNELYNPKNIHQTFDPSLTALFITEYLGIPFGKLPAIIFTPDLNLPYFYWMRTDVASVNGQLEWLKTIPISSEFSLLGSINDTIQIKRIKLKSKFSFLLVDLSQKISQLGQGRFTDNEYGPNDYQEIPKKQKPTEKEIELNLFFSGIQLVKQKKNEFLDYEKHISEDIRFSLVRERPSSYNDIPEPVKPEPSKSFFSKLFNVLFKKRQNESEIKSQGNIEIKRQREIEIKRQREIRREIQIMRQKESEIKSQKESVKESPSENEKFERLVKINLQFLQRESILFLEQGINMSRSINSSNFYDYSPLILPFAKSFEKELSYSIVHWVRRNYDITLPLYFYEYEPGKKAKVFLGKNYTIDFNQTQNDSWISPTLGGQISGLKKAVTNFESHPFKSDLEYQEFLNLAYQIKNIRNRACHSEKTSRSDLDKILSCWKDLFEKNYFETLALLKKEYMGSKE